MSDAKTYELTDEQKAQLKPWADQWLKIAMRTEPMTADDRGKIVAAMHGLYTHAKFPPPKTHIFCRSPISGGLATTIAAAAIWLRKNPEKHVEEVGRVLSDTEIVSGCAAAAVYVAERGSNIVAGVMGDTLEEACALRLNESAIDAAMAQCERLKAEAVEETLSIAMAALKEPVPPAECIPDAAPDVLKFFMGACQHWQNFWNGGNHWAGWVSYISFFRHVVKLDLPEFAAFAYYEDAARHGSHRFMHTDFWVVSDFPTTLTHNEKNEPHSVGAAPALTWPGWELHATNGTQVPTFKHLGHVK